MRFHGLFVGIDRYESPQINWLACARRDAIALHALFGDTLGGTSTILLDEKATKRNIAESFTAFSKCDEEDVVVMAWSRLCWSRRDAKSPERIRTNVLGE